MRSLSEDPFEQSRAVELLRGVTTPLSTGLKRVLDPSATWPPVCQQRELVGALVVACQAGLAFACRDLYAVGGCLRAVFRAWPGSFAPPSWAPGSFAFLGRDLPLRSDGRALGTVRRGTKVVVLGVRGNDVAIYVLEPRIEQVDELDPRLLLSVPKEALSAAPVELTAHVLAVPTARGHARYVLDKESAVAMSREPYRDGSPEHHAWSAFGCTPIAILEEVTVDGRPFQRVSQELDGVVLEGWIDKPIRWAWGASGYECESPPIVALESSDAVERPTGYEWVAVDDTTQAVQRWMRSTGTLTMIEFDEAAPPRCVTREWKRGELLGPWEASEAKSGRRWRSAQSFDADGRTLRIDTSGRYSDGTTGPHVRCYDVWEVVRVTDRTLEVISGNDGRAERIRAYHPSTTTRWWLHPEDCEAELAAHPNYMLEQAPRREGVAQDTSPRVGGLGC